MVLEAICMTFFLATEVIVSSTRNVMVPSQKTM